MLRLKQIAAEVWTLFFSNSYLFVAVAYVAMAAREWSKEDRRMFLLALAVIWLINWLNKRRILRHVAEVEFLRHQWRLSRERESALAATLRRLHEERPGPRGDAPVVD